MNSTSTNHIQKAENFLLDAIRNGLAHSYDVIRRKWVKPYPEVTGYLLSYFSKFYEILPPKILDAARTLCNLQHKIGGYSSFSHNKLLYTFDTAQIMHGLASIYKKIHNQKYLDCAIKCGEFILRQQISSGAMFPIYNIKLGASYVNKKGTWGETFSPIQVKNIEGLLLLSEITKNSSYKECVQKLRNFGLRHCDLTYTHPGAYYLEGLLELGEKEFVREKLKQEIEDLKEQISLIKNPPIMKELQKVVEYLDYIKGYLERINSTHI